MPNNLPYRVSWSREAVEALKESWRKATDSDWQQELAQIVKSIDDVLRREPLAFGEIYRSRGAVEEHLAVRDFVAVNYAVDRVRKFVLVRTFDVLSRRTS